MTDERFAVQVEHRLAGLLSPPETAELSSLLEKSRDARGQYLRAVEVHLDLGTSLGACAPGSGSEEPEGRSAMARISLNCSCGWNFFIPGTTTGHEASCPSCGQTVRIPGRKPGRDVPRSAGEVAAEAQRRQGLIRSLAGAAAAVIVAGGIGFWFAQTPELPPEPEPEVVKPPRRPVATAPIAPTIPSPMPEDPQRSIESRPNQDAEIQELRRAVYSNLWQSNMAGLISECLRYRNLTGEWSRMQADMARYGDKIKAAMAELAKSGEKLPIDGFLAPGDQILGFSQRDFTTMTRADAAAFLHQWIAAWQPGTILEQVVFIRNDKDVTLYLGFPEETRELQSLVRHPALALPGQPLPDPIVREVALPDDVIRDIQARFDALPTGYLTFLAPFERKQLETLTRSRRGSAKDLEWLQSRILGEALPVFQRETDHLRTKIAEMEPKLRENVASDVILRKDGGRFEGKIVEKNDEFLRIRLTLGTVAIPTKDILKIDEGKGAATQFPALLDAARRTEPASERVINLAILLKWCADRNLKLHKEYVALLILALNPSHENARKAAGIARPLGSPGGVLPSTPR